jgi:hypothetical protein
VNDIPTSTRERAVDLLRRGGLNVLDPDNTRFEPTLDPPSAEWLVSQMLALRSSPGIDKVVCWDEPEDLVLAHIVAGQLGIRWVLATGGQGEAAIVGTVSIGDRLALVTDAVRGNLPVDLIRNEISGRGAEFVGVWQLLDLA